MPEATVYVVDDDHAVRNSLSWLLESVGMRVECFASAGAFLEAFQPDLGGCVVLDVRMPGMSGLELQERLAAAPVQVPIIVVTGHGDIAMAVRAMKAGAIDFFEKPFNDQMVIERIQQCLEENQRSRADRTARLAFTERLASLTRRERQVYERVLVGQSNKRIANELGISSKTVEVHRARMMEKMGARSLAQLVAMSVSCRPPSPANRR